MSETEHRRLMGLESELSITGRSRDGQLIEPELMREWLLGAAKRRWKWVRDTNSSCGCFLQNGSRFYVDSGGHPEYATPECFDPAEAAVAAAAGERLVAAAAADVVGARRDVEAAFCWRTNIDYPSAAVWGCHESYLFRGSQTAAAKPILAHLCTRLIYCGAGGWDPKTEGLRFVLSPRACMFTTVESDSSTHSRPLFHRRNDPLCNGYDRVHVIFGDTLTGAGLATYLKLGATALILRLIERGRLVRYPSLRAPLESVDRIVHDWECGEELPLTDGSRLSAAQIQRWYLERVERELGEDWMPHWAAKVCVRWREVLDRLESGADALDAILEWRIKRKMFDSRLRRNGFSLTEAAAQASGAVPPRLALRHRTSELLRFRTEFLELDMRFGQLGDEGILSQLEARGLTHCRIPEATPGRIAQALNAPPTTGRAALRAAAIENAAVRSICHADWSAVYDPTRGEVLDISNPFQSTEHWRPAGA